VCDGRKFNAQKLKEMAMPMLTSEELTTIERDADRAPVQHLRLQVTRITKAMLSLEPDVADHACALLLKLERLIDDQCVPSAGTVYAVHDQFICAAVARVAA
jgi:hypothetical protein